MDTTRIKTAIANIEEHQEALNWLKDYGRHIGRDKESAQVTVNLNYASACHGAKAAAKILSAYAVLELPNVVETAIQSCRNTIEMEREVIADTINKATPCPTRPQQK